MSGTEEHPVGDAAFGLSYAHISRKERSHKPEHVATVWQDGRLLQVRDGEAQAQTGGGIRGEVQGFSGASRRRLMYLLASVDRTRVEVPLFVTLTYPGEDWERFGGRKEEVKRHLDVLRHWLFYHHPGAIVIWRLEFQKRGAPHFHLLVFGVGFIDCHYLAYEWHKAVGSGQATHLLSGTQVCACKSWVHATSYVSKYLAKKESFADSDVPIHSLPGRIWGIWGRKFLPREAVEYALTDEQLFQLRRIMRGYCRSAGYRLKPLPSFSTFIGSSAGHRALAWVGADLLSDFVDPESSEEPDRSL